MTPYQQGLEDAANYLVMQGDRVTSTHQMAAWIRLQVKAMQRMNYAGSE